MSMTVPTEPLGGTTAVDGPENTGIVCAATCSPSSVSSDDPSGADTSIDVTVTGASNMFCMIRSYSRCVLPSLPKTRTGGFTADTVSAVVVISACGGGATTDGEEAGGDSELAHAVSVAVQTATPASAIACTATAPGRTAIGAASGPARRRRRT